MYLVLGYNQAASLREAHYPTVKLLGVYNTEQEAQARRLSLPRFITWLKYVDYGSCNCDAISAHT